MRRIARGCLLIVLPVLSQVPGRPACAADDDLVIRVQVSGAVNRAGTYRHAADGQHFCRPPLEVPPPPTPGGHFDNLPFTVDFDAAARPPESSFRLAIPGLNQAPGTQPALAFSVAMTAGGQLWQGEFPPLTGSMQTQDAGRRGNFSIAGLTTPGSKATITVQGDWTCPHLPSDFLAFPQRSG